jgi:hypothetical protein
MIQDTTLTLAANISDERLSTVARELARDLIRAGIEARPVEAATARGERGDPVTLGALALALITSKAVTALIECLKAYFARERTLIVKIKRPDGTVIEVNAKNVDDPVIEQRLYAAASPL